MAKTKIISSKENLQITAIVQAWLDEQGYNEKININHKEHSSTLKTSFHNQPGQEYRLIIEVKENHHLLSIFLFNGIEVSSECLNNAVILVNTINNKLDIGRIVASAANPFQYRQSVNIEGGTISTIMITNMVDCGIQVFEDHLVEMQKVVDCRDPLKLEDLKDAYHWESIEGNKNLKNWTLKLEQACKEKTTLGHWQMIGKAAIIVNGDADYCSQVLKTVAKQAKFNYIKVAKDDVLETIKNHDFKKLSPAIIYLEPGRWQREKWDSDTESEKETHSYEGFRIQVKQILGDFSPKNPVVYLTSASNLEESVADDLKCKDAFDLYMSISKKSIELVGRELINQLNKKICGRSLTNAHRKIGHLVNSYSEQKKELTVLALKRLHHDLKRKIEYIDLVGINAHSLVVEGFSQEKNNQILLQTAYHEAGHALVTILEYDGLNIPDYTSILPGTSGFSGITLESICYYSKGFDDSTYLNMRRSIRVALGGRIGEEILVGPENVSAGASSDLKGATKKTSNAFKFNGFAPEMGLPGNAESNLAIIIGPNPTASEISHVENLTREFLAQEYRLTRDKLMANKLVLDDIANQLMTDLIVSQEELIKICKKHKIKVIQN